MNRSGTKFFKSLCLGHRDISQGFSLEDYAITYSDRLLDYASLASRHWGRSPEDKGPQRDRLLGMLSDCVLQFFSQGYEETPWLLLTTPRPWGIENLTTLFPDAKLLILVRDGRDCVASSTKSFGAGKNFSMWSREWARGAQTVLDFSEKYADRQHELWDFVCFEEVLADKKAAIVNTLLFLGLSYDGFDESVLEDRVIRGSGWHGGVSTNAPMTEGFNTVGRHSDWSLLKRWPFDRTAGDVYRRVQSKLATSRITPSGSYPAVNRTPSVPR